MPSSLTEVATFDPTVTVPDGSDDMSNAAEVVQAIAQVLANRSRYLKSFTDNAAQTNVVDVIFSGRVTSNNIDPEKSGFRIGNGPHDAVQTFGGALPTNKWIPALEAPLTSTQKLRYYQGDGVEGYTAITVNANYDSGNVSPSWMYDDVGQHAYAFMLNASGVWRVYSYRGSNHWTVWDNTDSKLAAHELDADNFNYIAAAPFDERVNLSRVMGQALIDHTGGIGAIGFQSDLTATLYTVSGVPHCDLVFPIDLKRDTVVSSVKIEINHSVSGTGSEVFTLRKRHGALNAIAYDDVVHGSPASGLGEQTVILSPTPFTVARGEEYSLVWTIIDMSNLSAAKVYGIDVNCTQPGPRS